MKRLWSANELYESWTLSPDDLAFIVGNADAGRLGLASQLTFWRSQGRFPDEEADFAPAVIAHLAGQLGTPAEDIESYAFAGRSGRRHRQLVLDRLAVGTLMRRPRRRFARGCCRTCFPASRRRRRSRTRSLGGSPRGAWSGPDRIGSTD